MEILGALLIVAGVILAILAYTGSLGDVVEVILS